MARERDARREDQLAGLPGQPQERLERVEQRDEAGRLPAHGAGVAQPAGRVVEEADRQPHRRLRRIVEQAEGAEGGVDDRLGRLVGAAQHLERGLAEERGGQCEQDVDGGRGVEVGPQREIAGRRRPRRAPPQHRPGRVELEPRRAGRRAVLVGAEPERPRGTARAEREVGGPAEAARAGRRVDGERPGGQVGDDGRRAGDEADGGRVVSGHGRDAGQERPRPAGELLPPRGVGQGGRDERGRVVHQLLDRVGDAAVGGEQLQRLEHGPERGGRRRRHGRGRLGDDPLRGERQQEADLRGRPARRRRPRPSARGRRRRRARRGVPAGRSPRRSRRPRRGSRRPR